MTEGEKTGTRPHAPPGNAGVNCPRSSARNHGGPYLDLDAAGAACLTSPALPVPRARAV